MPQEHTEGGKQKIPRVPNREEHSENPVLLTA